MQASPPPAQRWLTVLGPFFALALVVSLFGLGLLAHDLEGFKGFVSVRNIKTVLAQTVIVSIGALGMTLIVVSGGIDLSAGSAVALTSVLGAKWLLLGWPPALVMLAAVLAGGLLGVINGGLIAGFRMMPFIVTLGMMGVCRGGAKWVANNQVVLVPQESSLNHLMTMADVDHGFSLPIGVWVAAGLAVLMALIMRRTVFGRYALAIGASEATATYSGIQVPRQKVLIYGLAGLFFGCAGLMQMTRLSEGDPSGALGMELDMIAAVVVGGASLSGGRGSILGSVIGALTMQVLRSGTSQMLWPTYMQEIIIGAVIIVAVGLDGWRRRR